MKINSKELESRMSDMDLSRIIEQSAPTILRLLWDDIYHTLYAIGVRRLGVFLEYKLTDPYEGLSKKEHRAKVMSEMK